MTAFSVNPEKSQHLTQRMAALGVRESDMLPSPNIEALCEELPTDIRHGLNWAEDKQFTFLLSVLSPPEDEPVSQTRQYEAGQRRFGRRGRGLKSRRRTGREFIAANSK